MTKEHRSALAHGAINAVLLVVVMTIITGVAYPLLVTGISALFFGEEAKGSLICRDGLPVGSALLGQDFGDPGYFHGRPSAAGDGYDASSSGGSNLGPTNELLLEDIAERAERVREENGLEPGYEVPSDLVTASASGLDPDISPESAYLQVERIATYRGIDASLVRELIAKHSKGRLLGFIGQPRVNVLELNLALDELAERQQT